MTLWPSLLLVIFPDVVLLMDSFSCCDRQVLGASGGLQGDGAHPALDAGLEGEAHARVQFGEEARRAAVTWWTLQELHHCPPLTPPHPPPYPYSISSSSSLPSTSVSTSPFSTDTDQH